MYSVLRVLCWVSLPDGEPWRCACVARVADLHSDPHQPAAPTAFPGPLGSAAVQPRPSLENRPDVLPCPVPEARETSVGSRREVPLCLLSRRPQSGRTALSAVELLLEDTFQGHSFCLEQGLGLKGEPETGTNCTSLLNLEPNPNIYILFNITENQTRVLGFG